MAGVLGMILAGGEGSRLKPLTETRTKPAVPFGGSYRLIDFALNNFVNADLMRIYVLTQFKSQSLYIHMKKGWNLSGITDRFIDIIPAQMRDGKRWYEGTADAIYQNLRFVEIVAPDQVCIFGSDHIYKMDYEVMLDFHKENNADVTIATMPVPLEEASRFGIVIADEDKRIQDFEEKPEHPRSNLASMGIYIFSWKVLKEALTAMKDQSNCDFGKHIIPYCHEKKQRLFAYEYNGYWKDVGTLGSYWEANMELIDLIPEFNLYEEYWKIYTKSDIIQPQYLSADSIVEKSIIGEGSEIYGEVHSSVIGAGVTIGKGSVVRDSIIMKGTQIGENVVIDKAIIAENCSIGDNVTLGVGEEKPNKFNEKIYSFGLVTIGEDSEVPSNVSVGKNTAISGKTTKEDYPEGILDSGEVIIKAGDSE